MTWGRAAWIAAGVFTAGIAVGIAAEQRGIPRDQVPRWLVKGALRRGYRVARGVAALAEPTEARRLAGEEEP